jgi:DNA-binding NtrC family response regulator
MTLPTIRLLIIDDEHDLLQVLKDTAPFQGFDVTLAQSVDDAVALLDRGLTVDVVLCDVSMPDGGAEFWVRRCASAYPALVGRTIAITGWSGTSAPATLQIPEERCLYKPFTMSDVRRMAVRLVPASS